MTRSLVLALLLSAVLPPAPAAAQDMGGANLVIPAVGRVFGGFGTQWHTDLAITNLKPEPVQLFVSFYEDDRQAFTDVGLPSFGTIVLEDVILTTFERESALGMIRVSSGNPEARFVARAYVYNRGNPAGEFGQGIPGLPIDELTQEHVLSGIASSDGTRTNAGVANPWPVEVDVILVMHGPGGEAIGQVARTIPPLTSVQMTDIFTVLGAPAVREASIRVYSSAGVYPYASVVRNDTGDAVFVPGSGVRLASSATAPQCAEPAPMILPYQGAPEAQESFVVLKSGTERSYVLEVLAPQHGIEISRYHDDVPGFEAILTSAQIAAVRCEPVVSVIRRDGVTLPLSERRP